MPRSTAGFPSLGRYRALLASDLFRAAFRNTIVVVLLSLVLEIGLGLLVALTLHRRFPLRGLVRTLVLMPLGVPTVVSAAVMLLVFSRVRAISTRCCWRRPTRSR